ncbi:MAG: hypothetical protein K2H45_15145 [Acetatifactor sp.]|nr:hypothetical protein [Acetatifactor sp.]
MIRTFTTHRIRKQEELTGKLWVFSPLQGESAGEQFQVPTPSCWENYPDFGLYRGEGIYSTQFAGEGNLRIVCKGVSHTATVLLDGRCIAEHYNAYTAFSTVVPAVPAGIHTLEIIADNRFSEKSALHVPNDYMSYGGVTRPVVLEQVADAYIEQVHVTPSFREGCWHARIEVTVHNILRTKHSDESGGSIADEFCSVYKTADILVTIAGETLSFPARALPAGRSIHTGELAFCDVIPWSCETPVLYEVEAVLQKDGQPFDDLIDRFGFREIRTEGKHILLNGRPLRIKGLCRHEDHPQFGCALPFAAMANDLALIKHLGANSVRTSHYPNDEIFLDLCDEQGILVWEENHARGLSLEQMQNPNFEPQAEQVIQEMIEQHYNHPSIYIWGILNECASDTEYGRDCYRRQFDLIRSLDCSRPCSFASCKVKCDISLGLPDVVSYNIYPLWYHDTPPGKYLNDLYQWVQKETEGKGKPFLITEIGAGGIYGHRSTYSAKWSEEYQARALKEQIEAVLSYLDCAGIYIWQFCDIRISEEGWYGRPRTMNNKGIVDEYRRPKLCYEVVKKLFEAEEIPDKASHRGLPKDEISDRAHRMDLSAYETARFTFYSQNQEELHEIVQTYINTLCYNAAWDFDVTEGMEEREYKTVLTFKYNGTILALNAVQKLHFGYAYRKEFDWRCKEK